MMGQNLIHWEEAGWRVWGRGEGRRVTSMIKDGHTDTEEFLSIRHPGALRLSLRETVSVALES